MKDELGFGSNADGVIYRDLSHDGISNDLWLTPNLDFKDELWT